MLRYALRRIPSGLLIMVVSSLLALAFMLTRRTVNRIEAALLVVFYVMLLPFLL